MKTNSLLLACAALAVAAPTAEPEPIKIGLRRSRYETRADGSANVALAVQDVQRTLNKYHAKSSLTKRGKKANLPLIDQVESPNEDELYYGNGVTGTTAPQTWQIDFDTGSADFFVPGPSCDSTQGCNGNQKYNQMGTDEGNTTMVVYGSGEVTGENYFDQVCVAGLCAKHTNVVSLSEAQGFSGSDANSLMGMGFSTIANSGQPTFFENLMAQKVVALPEFAFFLGRAASGTQNKSEMTLGGVDTTKYHGTVTQVPVTTKGYWQVAVDAVYVNGTSAGATTPGQAAIDTGTTILLAPTDSATAIFSEIPGALPLPGLSGSPIITLFGYPCNTTATVAMGFAGKKFPVNKLDFSLGTLGDDAGIPGNPAGYCLAAIAGADIDPTENLYVVGDTFIKNWYSIFSYKNKNGVAAVGFAPVKGNPVQP